MKCQGYTFHKIIPAPALNRPVSLALGASTRTFEDPNDTEQEND